MNLSEKKRKPNGKLAGESAKRGAGEAGPMNVDFLQRLVDLMASNDLSTVELCEGEKRIMLKRGGEHAGFTTPAANTPAPVGARSAALPTAPSASSGNDDEAGLVPIKSPMVGTFYAAGSPDAKPFVQVGSTVDEETDVCIIEAMKVFNNIKAETRGTIAKVLVTNGQTVEFGTVLFLVKPS